MSRPPPPKPVAPPEPPKPLPPPKASPPPPKAPPPLAKAEPPKPVPALEAPPQPEMPEQPPVDTGSSSPSAADGELYAGGGGLGAAPPPPPAPPAPPPPPAPIIAAREGANYLKNPRPPYPSRAQREGWEGTTLLRVQVNPLGKPGTIQIQTSSGRSVLDDAAVEAVKAWTFTPATQGGKPISGWVTVPIVFKLQ